MKISKKEASTEITYPCLWTYKIIGKDPDKLQQIIQTICAPLTVTISPSHKSSKGTYHSLNAQLELFDETTRLTLYRDLKKHPEIKIVL